jgi:hypothetical protein
MPTIYEISDDLRALHDLLAESGGELTPQTEAAFAAFESELSSDLHGKLDRYCSLIAELEALATARKAEAKRLADLARTNERSAEALRERLRWVFEARGLGTQQTERFRVSLAANGGKLPLVVLCAEDELPAWATKSRVSADTEAIRERLEAGESLLFARLGDRGRRISIR